jgi:hypothetical protein
MIRSFFFLLLALIFSSCVTPGRIVEISGSTKDIQGIKLTQNPIARSADDAIPAINHRSHSVSMIYLVEQKKNERPNLFLDVQIETTIPTDQLDSVMVINLDNEEIRIAANECKSKEFPKSNSGNKKIISNQFLIPENLWVSIVYSDEIQYLFYLAKEGIDVKLNPKETSKLKDYFNRAIQLRDANLPLIPEGQKKW